MTHQVLKPRPQLPPGPPAHHPHLIDGVRREGPQDRHDLAGVAVRLMMFVMFVAFKG